MTTKSDVLKAVADYLARESKHTYADAHILKRDIERQFGRSLSDVETQSTIPFHIAMTAYVYTLNNSCTPQEALEYAALQHGEDGIEVYDMRHNPYYHAKRVVETADKEDVQKAMKEQGVLKPSTRRSLVGARTVNSQLNSLNDLLEITQKQTKMQQEIDELKRRVGAVEDNVDLILATMELKDKIDYLRKQGWKQKEIAEKVERSLSTVKRYSQMLNKEGD